MWVETSGQKYLTCAGFRRETIEYIWRAAFPASQGIRVGTLLLQEKCHSEGQLKNAWAKLFATRRSVIVWPATGTSAAASLIVDTVHGVSMTRQFAIPTCIGLRGFK